MNDNENKPNEDPGIEAWIDPAWETRIVALLQGEASDFETEDLEKQMRENPELRVFHRRMKAVHGLLEAAVGDGGKAEGAGAEEWKLAPARREAVLARLREKKAAPAEVVGKKGPNAMNLVKVECPKAAELRRRKAWTWAISSAAAVFLALMMSARLFVRYSYIEDAPPEFVVAAYASDEYDAKTESQPRFSTLGESSVDSAYALDASKPSSTPSPTTAPVGYRSETIQSGESILPSLASAVPDSGEQSFGEGFGGDGAQVAANFESHFGDDVRRYAIPEKMEDLPVSGRLFAGADKAARSMDEAGEVAQADAKGYFGKEGQSADGENWSRSSRMGREDSLEQAPTTGGLARPEIVKGDKDRSLAAAEGNREKAELFGWDTQPGAVTSLETKLENAESANGEWVDLNEAVASGEPQLAVPAADPMALGIPADGASDGAKLESGAKLADRLKRVPSRNATTADDGLDVEGKDAAESGSRMTATRRSLEEGRAYRELGDLDKAGERFEDAYRMGGEKDEALKELDDLATVRLAAETATLDQTRGKMLQEVDQLWEESAPPTDAPAGAAPETTVAGKKFAADDFGLAPEAVAGLEATQSGDESGPVSMLALKDATVADGRVEEELRKAMPMEPSGGGGFAGGGSAGGLAVPGQSPAKGPEVAAKPDETWGGVRFGREAVQDEALDGLLTNETLGTELAEQVAGNGQAQQQQGQTDLSAFSRQSGIAGESARPGGDEFTTMTLETAPEVVEFEGFINGGNAIAEREFLGGAANLRGFGYGEVPPTAEPQAATASGVAPSGEVAITGAAMPEGEVALGFDVDAGSDSLYLFRGVDVAGADAGAERVFASGGTAAHASSEPTNWAFTTPEGARFPREMKVFDDGSEPNNQSLAEIEAEVAKQKEKVEAARITVLDVVDNNDLSDLSSDLPQAGYAPSMDEKRTSISLDEARSSYTLEAEKLAAVVELRSKRQLEADFINGRVDEESTRARGVTRDFYFATEYDPPEIPQEFGSVAGGAVTAFPVTPANPTSFEENGNAPATVNFAKDFLAGDQLAARGDANGRDLGSWKTNAAVEGKKLGNVREVEELASLEKVLEEVAPETPAEPVVESKPTAEPEPAPVEEPAAPIEAQPEIETAVEPASTFSLHVSDVSFKLAEAALLEKGEWPAAGKVRIEEFVNAFDYGDPAPTQDEAVACRTEQAAHPFLPQRNLLRVAMRTGATGRASSQPLRLTVLLDKSGSMERADREASVQRAMEALASHLSANDSVTLIGFARQPRLIADRLSGERANELAGMVERAPSEGGTNLEEALNLAAAKAKEQFVEGGQNRIVLLTDGAANLGNARPESLAERVVALRQEGIAFDACGVGADGLNDAILEALTRKGDGRYYFLNRAADADESFVRQLAGALRPAAKNVKVQVIFNPERVTRYRLLGFEKHMLKKEDFRNDTVDAAEMAAAEAGVGLYEMEVNAAGQGDVGEVFVRFQDMATGEMVERSWTIPYDAGTPALDEATPSMQLAGTAAFLGMKLRGGPDAGMVRFEDLGAVTSGLRTKFAGNARVGRLVQMVGKVRE